MQINITGDNVELSPALRDYVESKMQRVHKIFSNMTNVHVILRVDNKLSQQAEAVIHLAGAEVFAKAESTDMYAAIDVLMDKLEKQVTAHKETIKKRNGGGI